MQQNRVLPQNPRRPALHRQQNRVKDAFHFDFLAGEPPSGEKLLALYAEAFPLELITSNTETELKRDGDGGEGADGSESSGQLCLELSHSLLQGGGRRARGIESLHRGPLQSFTLDLVGTIVDTPETWQTALAAIDSEVTHTLVMRTALIHLPFRSLRKMGSLTSVSLSGCQGLVSLPAHLFGGLRELSSVDLSWCSGLEALPEDLFQDSTLLVTLNLHFCIRLPSLPESLFDGLTSLESLDVTGCCRLQCLPAILTQTGVNVAGAPLSSADSLADG